MYIILLGLILFALIFGNLLFFATKIVLWILGIIFSIGLILFVISFGIVFALPIIVCILIGFIIAKIFSKKH